ncbi:MAG: pantoate--beta-alanine ligase [Gammaproteobacteria bacterium]|nr:pantoate--beta-alanine ligase [Gammaproteobacteria bacterium]
MQTVENIADVSGIVGDWKKQQLRVAFVPTMGNLHAGHLSLVEKARSVADKVVVSIYVNPMQFGENEDFDSYPRTLDADSGALVDAGVDLLFLPTDETMYPVSKKLTTQVYVPEISEILCGKGRPGHFLGVTTVVNKLFNIVRPDVAIFGQKDFQQVAIIRRMVADLFMPIEIIALPTMRESDGLAMSSRNQYLNPAQREAASNIRRALELASDAIKNGADIAEEEAKAAEFLRSSGFEPEYVSFRDPLSLAQLFEVQNDMVVLVAAKLGVTRLIDNCLITLRNGE